MSVFFSFLDLSLGGVPPGMQCSFFFQLRFAQSLAYWVSSTYFIIVLVSLDGSRRKILE